MEKKINVNEFIFGRTKAEKKLQVLDAMSDNDIRKTSDATILRIYKECRGKDSDGKPNDRFWIKKRFCHFIFHKDVIALLLSDFFLVYY